MTQNFVLDVQNFKFVNVKYPLVCDLKNEFTHKDELKLN